MGPATYHNQNTAASRLQACSSATQTIVKGGPYWFAGTDNGGVWRTGSDLGAHPDELDVNWTPVTDNQPVTCSSIASMATNGKTILAGCGGSTSSELGRTFDVLNTGPWGGIMISNDYGNSWAMTKFPANFYVSSLVINPTGRIIAGAVSHWTNSGQGGIWYSDDMGETWTQTSEQAVFDIKYSDLDDFLFAASPVTGPSTLLRSTNGGQRWEAIGHNVTYSNGKRPFYNTLAVSNSAVFLGALTVNPSKPSDTGSDVFYGISSYDGGGVHDMKRIAGAPKLDDDAMPKDRMTLFADPTDSSYLYAAGNGGTNGYRIEYKTGKTVPMFGGRGSGDGSTPHSDCRNFAYDYDNNNLLLVTDGGLFRRSEPTTVHGNWTSLNGDMRAMEFLTAHYDFRLDRIVGGAQDNAVQVTPAKGSNDTQALAIIGGDGTQTLVDNGHNPARLCGAVQFNGGFTCVEGSGEDMKRIGIPLPKYFGPEAFPYFVSAAVFNTQKSNELFIWANSCKLNLEGGQFWSFTIPDDAQSRPLEPKFVQYSHMNVLTFTAGGYSNGKSDHDMLVAFNETHMLHRATGADDYLLEYFRELPVMFASPVNFKLVNGDIVLGPLTHSRTVFAAVSPRDSSVVAVTGRQSVEINNAPEGIYVSGNAGVDWTNIIGNLREVTGAPSARPMGLLLVPMTPGNHAVVVGAINGVYVSFIGGVKPKPGEWQRLGTVAQLPRVLGMGLSLEGYSDTLIAATFGRGVYKLAEATSVIADIGGYDIRQVPKSDAFMPKPRMP